jgi:hypothetical protein
VCGGPMVGILWLEERAEKRDRAIPLMAIGGLFSVLGFGIAGLAGWQNHGWSGWSLVAFLVGFVIAAAGLIDVVAGALAFEFRPGPPLPPDAGETAPAKAPKG